MQKKESNNKIKEIELKIFSKRSDIDKKLLYIEINSNELFEILKSNYSKINNDFENICKKELFNYYEYYSALCDFYSNEICLIVKIIENSNNDGYNSIFDDSKKEISKKLEQKQREVLECIKNVDETYHDDTITNYIKNKYDLIMENFHKRIQEYLNYRRTIITNLYLRKDLSKINLTLYPDINYIKNDCILELGMTLDNVVKYLNALIENKKVIEETENSLLERINKIKDNKHLLKEFNNMKLRFITKTSAIHELDSKLCNIQKDYLKELNDFMQELINKEEYEKRTSLLLKILDYLNDTAIFKIRFSKLREIDNYLIDREDYQVKIVLERIYKTYYELIKYEVYYTGKSAIYDSLNDDIKRNVEKLFLEELKSNKELLIKEKFLQKILLEPFSIENMKEVVKYLLPNETINLNDYEIDDSNISKEVVIPYTVFNNKKYFENDKALVIDNDGNYYMVNKNGNVLPITITSSLKKLSSCHGDMTVCIHYAYAMVFPVADWATIRSERTIFNGCGEDEDKQDNSSYLSEYCNGLLLVQTPHNKEVWYIDKNGKEIIHILGKEVIGYDFSDGVAFVKVNGHFRAIDTKGKTLFKLGKNIKNVYSFKNGIARVKDEKGNMYFIDKLGKRILKDFFPTVVESPKHDFTYGIALCNYCKVNTGYKLRLIDINGKILPLNNPIYEDLDELELEKYKLCKINDKYKFVKKNITLKDSDTLIEVFKDLFGNIATVEPAISFETKNIPFKVMGLAQKTLFLANNDSKILKKYKF